MRRMLGALVPTVLATALIVACTNEPFDPASVPNNPPTVRFYAGVVDSSGDLNATSYSSRTFQWSGTDDDGEVVRYFVSVRPDSAVPAPWDTTTRTDTTMTFATDDQGEAQATFLLVCEDDRGAVSDTLVQYVPLRNFPPALNFQSDFDPLVNLQREFVMEGETVTDTVYWNYGVMNVRCFAFDLDGNQTMDTFYRYTLSDDEPTETYDEDDSLADPLQHWLRVPFDGIGDVYEFEFLLDDVPPGERTLTVAVADEAAAESRITLSWEVRAPVDVGDAARSRVLMVPDNSAPFTRDFYRGVLDEIFGSGSYNEYDFWFGFPDRPSFLLATLRLFDVVLWFDGGGTSSVLERAAATDGVLQQYLAPLDGGDPGRLVMISRNLTGNQSGIPAPFRQRVFGISPSADPAPELRPSSGTLSLEIQGAEAYLPPLRLANLFGRGRGLQPRYDEDDPYDELYRFEPCIRCWDGQPPTQEWAPLIAVRRPKRDDQRFASAIGISYEMHTMQRDGVVEALAGIFQYELGVAAP
jgi:hypothetical protein